MTGGDREDVAEARAVAGPDFDPAIEVVDPQAKVAELQGESGAAMFMGGDSPYASDIDRPDAKRVRNRSEPDATSTPDHPTAAIPSAFLQDLDRDRVRALAKRQGVDWPTTREVRRRLQDRLRSAMRAGESTVIGAPTGAGKTYAVATEPWRTRASATGEAPVIAFHETREARDQARQESVDTEGVTSDALLGRQEACSVAAGDFDPAPPDADEEERPPIELTVDGQPASEYIDERCDECGVAFSVAHAHVRKNNDQGLDTLPCCFDDDGNEVACEAVCQHEGTPRKDGEPTVDVLHATHNFLHVPKLRFHTNVVVDELPDFTEKFGFEASGDALVERVTSRVQRAITAYLRAVDAPVTTWEGFVGLAKYAGDHGDTVAEARATRDCFDETPDREWYLEHPDAHTLAPALAEAIWRALDDAPDDNGRRSARVRHEPPRFDAEARDNDYWNLEHVSVVLDRDNRVRTVRVTPDLSQTRSVIGLDAYPCMPLWRVNVDPALEVDHLLGPAERRRWRFFERGLEIVQVGDATRPLSTGKYFNEDHARALVTHLRDEYGDDFRTAITAGAVEDNLARLMRGAGVDDVATMHAGEEKSRNDFAGEPVGLYYGCIDPGDDFVLDVLAERDLEATPERSDPLDCSDPENAHCEPCGGDGCSECNGTGLKRAHGRDFEGPDAETAKALLESVRATRVAQGAGRWARNPEDPDDRATVFVATDAIPSGFVDVEVPGIQWVPTGTQQRILDALADRGEATVRELADEVDVTKETVRSTLQDVDGVARREGVGAFGADLYGILAEDIDVLRSGEVDLAPEEIANEDVVGSSTWSLAIRPPSAPTPAGHDTPTVETTATPDSPGQQRGLASFNGGDRPPDDAG